MEVVILLLLIAGGIALWLLESPSGKGLIGEKKVKIAADIFLGSQYHRIDNVTFAFGNRTTQIDHIIVSEFGIFVVETKNMKGWIFGHENQPQWTQTLYRKSYKFQNPLRQNHLHVMALQAALGTYGRHIRSVVVFSGRAKFKTRMPENVTHIAGFIGHIKSFKSKVFTNKECNLILEIIERSRLFPASEISRKHVKDLKKTFSSVKQGVCPRCGGRLVVRISRNGPNPGRKFFGCSSYPKCKYTCAVT